MLGKENTNLVKRRNLEVENMILNLHKPRFAEQFRIRKLVEDQLSKIDEQVHQEIKENSLKKIPPKER